MDKRDVGVRSAIVIGAVAVLGAALSAPAIGHGVHAAFAHNADKVDNKHAVGAGASSGARAGKLVATNSSGKLPNNIIAKAPNSAKLDGKTYGQTASRVAADKDETDGDTTQIDFSSATINTVTINAPKAGFLIISGMVTVNPISSGGYSITPQVDGSNVVATGPAVEDIVEGTTRETLTYTTMAPVGAGNHTVTQILSRVSVADDTDWDGQELIVQFVPTGSVSSP